MRVLQINAVYEKFSTGRTVQELHKALCERGHDSYVAAPDIGNLTTNAYKIGNKYDWKIHAFLSRTTGLQGYFSVRETKKLLKYIDQVKPDLVFLRNLHSNYINLQLLLSYIAQKNIAVVIVLHDSWLYTGKCVYYIEDKCDKWMHGCGRCPALKKGNPSWLFDRSAKMLADKKKWFSNIHKLAVIGVSDWTAGDARHSILSGATMIKRIYNWIDLQLFCPHDTSPLREKLGLNDKIVILGLSMLWIPQKGIEIFLKLGDLLPDNFQIVLVGSCDRSKYDSKKIKFLGTVKDTKYLADLYAMADIFVNPTIQDTFGKTTAEAMASGTPVVAYNCTALPELLGLDGSCGELVDEYDAESFLSKIQLVYRKLASKYKFMCRKRAENLFDKDKNIEEYIRLCSDLIAKK